MTFVQIIEIESLEESEVDIDEVHDSIMDMLLDAQNETRDTSDDKFQYTPEDIIEFKLEPIPEN